MLHQQFTHEKGILCPPLSSENSMFGATKGFGGLCDRVNTHHSGYLVLLNI